MLFLILPPPILLCKSYYFVCNLKHKLICVGFYLFMRLSPLLIHHHIVTPSYTVQISCLLGFGWSFGFIAAFANSPAVWTIFIITSSLQAVFVFVFFGANHRVRGLWRKRIRESKSEGRSTSNTGTQSTGTSRARDRERKKITASGSAPSATQV